MMKQGSDRGEIYWTGWRIEPSPRHDFICDTCKPYSFLSTGRLSTDMLFLKSSPGSLPFLDPINQRTTGASKQTHVLQHQRSSDIRISRLLKPWQKDKSCSLSSYLLQYGMIMTVPSICLLFPFINLRHVSGQVVHDGETCAHVRMCGRRRGPKRSSPEHRQSPGSLSCACQVLE
jgi:hypothetical protein